jgi:hypothetical protein
MRFLRAINMWAVVSVVAAVYVVLDWFLPGNDKFDLIYLMVALVGWDVTSRLENRDEHDEELID